MRRIAPLTLALSMCASMGMTVFANQNSDEEIYESGMIEISSDTRSSGSQYVGDRGKGGIWYYGVESGVVFSSLDTNSYYNRVSVKPTTDIKATTSGWSRSRGESVFVNKVTYSTDGNRSFYDLR